MTEKLEFVATCLFGLERFVGEEIEALGYEKIAVMDGRVTFRADIGAMARANIWLRCAERLYLKLGAFPAGSFEELFEGTRKLPWERWIGKDDNFPVKGHAVKSRLYSLPDCQSIVKKAVVRRLGEKYGQTWFAQTGAMRQIEFFIFNDTATLMIDLSGAPLHKRGYRTQAGEAPLRETLAAAMVKISRPREEVLLWDPLCGSGTIALEAGLLMRNAAPGAKRAFCCENFPEIPDGTFARARQEAQDVFCRDSAFEAYASDIDPEMVQITEGNIRRAGMEGTVKTFVQDARTISADGRRGTIVTNPPYGERLLDPHRAHVLFSELGEQFAKLERWQKYILCADEEFPRYFGQRPDKVRRLYNGMIRCLYYQYFKSPQRREAEKKKQASR